MTTDEERDLAVTARREAAAMRHRQHVADMAEEGFEPDGPPDSYWQDADDSRYRADMRDAGRGGVLRW